MSKFRFLCSNHHQWLTENPVAARLHWAQSYSRSLDLIDEQEVSQAVNHAGAAFESAEISLAASHPADDKDIRRFSDTAVLLVQTLYLLGEMQLARAITNSAVARLEQLLLQGTACQSVLVGCERLLRIGDALPARDKRATDTLRIH